MANTFSAVGQLTDPVGVVAVGQLTDPYRRASYLLAAANEWAPSIDTLWGALGTLRTALTAARLALDLAIKGIDTTFGGTAPNTWDPAALAAAIEDLENKAATVAALTEQARILLRVHEAWFKTDQKAPLPLN